FDADLEHATGFRVDRGLPQLLRIHFAQALEALDGSALLRFVQQPGADVSEAEHAARRVAATDDGTRLQLEFRQLLPDRQDGTELDTTEERLRHDPDVAEAMLHALDFDRRALLVQSRPEAKRVRRLAQATGAEAPGQAVQPALHQGGVGPDRFGHRRVLEH